jgi:4-oxalocrotonate tautomerase
MELMIGDNYAEEENVTRKLPSAASTASIHVSHCRSSADNVNRKKSCERVRYRRDALFTGVSALNRGKHRSPENAVERLTVPHRNESIVDIRSTARPSVHHFRGVAMPVIRVDMLAGRTPAQKSELAEVLTRETARIARCAPKDVQIVFGEFAPSSWAVGGALVAGHVATTQSES